MIFLLLKTGRRVTLILFYSVAGASLCLTYFVPLGQVKKLPLTQEYSNILHLSNPVPLYSLHTSGPSWF